MKVVALGADHGGCFKYRISEPARVVRQLGVEVETEHSIDVDAYEETKTGMVEVREVFTDADLIVVQRPLNNALTATIKQAKKQGIATLVEIDDDFHATSKYNMAHSGMFGRAHSNADWVSEACKEADWVTVSTPSLEKYAPHGRVSVLRNYVPESIFDIVPRYDRTDTISTLGWSGSVQTHPTDLQQARINQVLVKNKLGFTVVGDGEHVKEFLHLSSSVPFNKTGWVDLDDFYEEIASTMDIGIVPLEMSNFNQAKSHLKGLEMAALGIPFIATPTREYIRFEAYGIGKLAYSKNDWIKHTQRWVDRPKEYLRDAINYRDKIREEFTYELHAKEWLNTWEKAISHRKSQA